MSSRRIVPALAAVALLICSSCRIPTFGKPRSSFGEFYHVEAETDGKPHSSLMRQIIADRRGAMAEPVALVRRGESTSTWQVLCATNRGPTAGAKDTASYGNRVDSEVHYGRCLVEVPHVHHLDPIRGSKLLPFASNPTKQVELTPPQRLSRDRFFAELREMTGRAAERDVFVFIHGFNVDFERAVTRAAQMADDMPFNGAVVCYSWPSQGGVWNYVRDQQIADDSAAALAEFLIEMGDRLPPDVSLNVVAHSMGNRVLMQAMNRLPERFAYPRRFNEVVLAAPDVGVSDFERLFPAIPDVSRRVTLYASDGDVPLITSWLVNREQRAGDSKRLVRREKLETVDVSRVDVGFMGHSYYGNNRSVLRDLFGVIKQHHPPEKRYWLDEKKRAGGTHWEFDTKVSPIVRIERGVVR